MNIIKALPGIAGCADCSRTLFFNSSTCDGFEIDRDRTVDCWGKLCSSCSYQITFRNEDGSPVRSGNYCKYHFQWFLFQLSVDELEELKQYSSYKSRDNMIITITGEGQGQFLDQVLKKKRMSNQK